MIGAGLRSTLEATRAATPAASARTATSRRMERRRPRPPGCAVGRTTRAGGRTASRAPAGGVRRSRSGRAAAFVSTGRRLAEVGADGVARGDVAAFGLVALGRTPSPADAAAGLTDAVRFRGCREATECSAFTTVSVATRSTTAGSTFGGRSTSEPAATGMGGDVSSSGATATTSTSISASNSAGGGAGSSPVTGGTGAATGGSGTGGGGGAGSRAGSRPSGST